MPSLGGGDSPRLEDISAQELSNIDLNRLDKTSPNILFTDHEKLFKALN